MKFNITGIDRRGWLPFALAGAAVVGFGAWYVINTTQSGLPHGGSLDGIVAETPVATATTTPTATPRPYVSPTPFPLPTATSSATSSPPSPTPSTTPTTVPPTSTPAPTATQIPNTPTPTSTTVPKPTFTATPVPPNYAAYRDVKESIDDMVNSGKVIKSYDEYKDLYERLLTLSPIPITPRNRQIVEFNTFNQEYARRAGVSVSSINSTDFGLAYSDPTGTTVRAGPFDRILLPQLREDFGQEYVLLRQSRGLSISRIDAEYAGNIGELVGSLMLKSIGSRVYDAKDTRQIRSYITDSVMLNDTADDFFSKGSRAVRLHAEAVGEMSLTDLSKRISMAGAAGMFNELVTAQNPAGFIENLIAGKDPRQVAQRTANGIILALKPDANAKLNDINKKNSYFFSYNMTEG